MEAEQKLYYTDIYYSIPLCKKRSKVL